ncbi:MAG: cobalt transporter [Alphaproteobacteria bacterium]|nr:cobalt transporter [Alphaproteobacteria bacterium]
MFRRIFATALLAGFLGGLGISVVHEFTTTPIILHAEQFESKSSAPDQKQGSVQNPLLILAHGKAGKADKDGHEAWGPANGWERTLFTTLANIITGVGFALILVACFSLSGGAINGRTGVIWGMAGFGVMSLAPALGLPPEVPGAMTAELVPRQGWWFLCVAATAAGLWMLVFKKGVVWVVAGIALIAVPHIVGAPQPARIGGAVPPELAGHFAAASLVTAAIFWSLLGWFSGTFWRRFETRS